MSHTVKSNIDMKITDRDFLRQAGANIGVKVQDLKDYRLYDGTRVTGVGVFLPGWQYPVVITDKDEILYDNYEGRWGDKKELDKYVNHVQAEIQMDYLDKMGFTYEYKVEDDEVIVEVDLETV